MIVKRDKDWEVKPSQGEADVSVPTKLTPEQMNELKRKILLRMEEDVELESEDVGAQRGLVARLKHWFHW